MLPSWSLSSQKTTLTLSLQVRVHLGCLDSHHRMHLPRCHTRCDSTQVCEPHHLHLVLPEPFHYVALAGHLACLHWDPHVYRGVEQPGDHKKPASEGGQEELRPAWEARVWLRSGCHFSFVNENYPQRWTTTYQRILREGDFSDFTWLYRPTCVDSEQKPLNPELEKKNSYLLNNHLFTKIYSTVLVYWVPELFVLYPWSCTRLSILLFWWFSAITTIISCPHALVCHLPLFHQPDVPGIIIRNNWVTKWSETLVTRLGFLQGVGSEAVVSVSWALVTMEQDWWEPFAIVQVKSLKGS